MEKVIFREEILDYFNTLVYTLFQNNYFSYEGYAQNYVDKIIIYIIDEIHNLPHKTTPPPIQHLGHNYIFYKANNRTTWYIFFEKQEQRYLVTAIENNHSEIIRFLS